MSSRKKKEVEQSGEGIAEGVLRGFGLGSVLNGLEKSPAFKERLKTANEQIEENLRMGVQERGGFKHKPTRGLSIRPSVSSHYSVRTLVGDKPVRKFHARRFESEIKETDLEEEINLEERELAVDIFDEKDHLLVIMELPGVEKKDIKVDVDDDTLTISTDVPDRRYHKEVELPCAIKSKIKTTYKNGILKVRLEKVRDA